MAERELTVNEFADMCGVDRNIAGQTLRFFETKGSVKRGGQRRSADGRGKPAQIYLVPDKLEFELPKQA